MWALLLAAFVAAPRCCTAQSAAKAPPVAFTQGVITTHVSLPGNPYDKLLSRLDPAKGNLQAQMQQVAAGLTPAEQQQFQAAAAKLPPALAMGALMMPRNGTIYCKGPEARAVTDALTYHLENYFNSATRQGLLLLASLASPEKVNYTYDAAAMKKAWQRIIVTDVDYTVQRTAETALVAGYPSQKTTYTLKPGAARAAPAGPGQLPDKPVALDVWTSSQIPQLLNFAHPVYVPQADGITKLVVYFDPARKYQLVYEFARVQPRAVTAQELAIKTIPPVLDYAKDELQVGMKSMGVMLGGSPEQPAGDK